MFQASRGDAANQTLMDQLNASGDLFLTHTKLAGNLHSDSVLADAHAGPSCEEAWSGFGKKRPS